MVKFNEDSRVKIPALVHLTRLGYAYVPTAQMTGIHPSTNIFLDQFKSSLSKINNKQYSDAEVLAFAEEISHQLDANDMGRRFYKSLRGDFPCRLIDFDDFSANHFAVVTELTYKNEDEEFRPDITVLINGMPLAFIEVKKPNNQEGLLAEKSRIATRFKNEKFKKFKNITQLLVFSNNQEYDEEANTLIQGAFYATSADDEIGFNCFREEHPTLLQQVSQEDPTVEKAILLDNNLVAILGSAEYETNKSCTSPTNSILTSLFSLSRLAMILRYGIAYVEKTNDKGIVSIEKHIMRYPQLFASLALEKMLEVGKKKGIIWHTQGSGKTAFAYFNVFLLRDYYQRKNCVAKFYFVVDRLDLATQAKNEFESRGLKVELVQSKNDFIKNIGTAGSNAGNTGEISITVVNIQKFSEESISKTSDYALHVQRVYFLDEVHRSYNPKGSFLASLMGSDRNAVLVGLTGTPLIAGEYKSKELFGDYIHKYYYNKSIADGYTLKLLREGIETKFRDGMSQILKQLEIKEGAISKNQLFAHPKFVEPLVRYILDDYSKAKIALGVKTPIGAMIVCDSSEQARMLYEKITSNSAVEQSPFTMLHKRFPDGALLAAEVAEQPYMANPIRAALILHDEKTKQDRTDSVKDFKKGTLDFLIVYRMLLTGFDAPRLKKLYLLRVDHDHNLLQTLTRVNRPYKGMKYGYVVDFADIREEFDRTNKEYFKELQEELGDELAHYSELFKSPEAIKAEIREIEETLFLYDRSNLEEFQKTISGIPDKQELVKLKNAFESLKNLRNIIRVSGHYDLLERFSFEKVGAFFAEVENRLRTLSLKDRLEHQSDTTSLLNLAMEDMQFSFRKISEHELVIADKFHKELHRAITELASCLDVKDPNFITLDEELKRILKRKNIEELTAEELTATINELQAIYEQTQTLNRKDAQLAAKYGNDSKFARLHKRIVENRLNVLQSDIELQKILMEIKLQIDDGFLNNQGILDNKVFFEGFVGRTVLTILTTKGIVDHTVISSISDILVKEYSEERVA